MIKTVPRFTSYTHTHTHKLLSGIIRPADSHRSCSDQVLVLGRKGSRKINCNHSCLVTITRVSQSLTLLPIEDMYAFSIHLPISPLKFFTATLHCSTDCWAKLEGCYIDMGKRGVLLPSACMYAALLHCWIADGLISCP